MRATGRPLTPGWVAGSVRARHLLARRIGRDAARELAASPSLENALEQLAGTAYGGFVHPGADLLTAQRAVAAAVLWHVRVLTGWAPPGALEAIRALAAWFELVNVEDRISYIGGGDAPDPFALGGLSAGWRRLAGVQTLAELRAGLAGSAWGDPGSDDPAAIRLALRMAWARRVLAAVEEAGEWAAGAVALLMARELFMANHGAGALAAGRPPGVGARWPQAASLAALRAALPAQAAWALAGIDDPDDLWRGEVAWWRRVERDASAMALRERLGRSAVVGAVTLLGVDGRRVAAALEVAARGGAGLALEVFDDVA